MFDINTLPWLIPVGPLLAFAVIVLVTNRSRLVPATSHEYGGHHPDYEGMLVPVVNDWGRVVSIVVGMSGVVAALLISLVVVVNALMTNHFGTLEHVFASSIVWMDTGSGATGTASFNMGVLVDPLTAVMLVMVPIAVLCIFIYSIGYMAHDPRQARFFALISLFAGAMLILVVADNLLLLFVGWEIMGLCSYMLIGFWFEKESAYKAAIKAFTTTRVADVIMLLGIVYLYGLTGTLSFRDILYNPDVLDQLAATQALLIPGLAASHLIGIFLIIGTIGKSAQFPLHVWLPDAMEGPTPVSAMIHAAAMVSAGIYAIIRMYPLFAAGADPHHGVFNAPLLLMAFGGAGTALFAATIAVAQNDVKRVLAYSTISQLGFMMAALGMGAYIAAIFHLITHAFFKALLFMASGAVIHAMEHGEHHVHEHAHGHDAHAEHHEEHHKTGETADEVDTSVEHDGHELAPYTHFDPQDMRNMGGLRTRIPITYYTFLIGGMSLAGLPLVTAGFWSKDEILADGWYIWSEHGSFVHLLVFITLALAAFLTAFYTTRQLAMTFGGEARTEEAKHAGLGGPRSTVSRAMQLPLIILAFLAIVAGFVGVPKDFPLFGAFFSPEYNPFKHFVIEAFHPSIHIEQPPFNIIPVGTSFLVALLGVYVGWLVYWRKPLKQGDTDPLERAMPSGVYNTLRNKYYFDELYELVFIRPSQWFSRVVVSEFVDRGIIDGLLHLTARVFNWIGDLLKLFNLWLIDGVGDGIPRGIGRAGLWLRRVQTGRVQQYLLLVMAAILIVGLIFVLSSGVLQAAGS